MPPSIGCAILALGDKGQQGAETLRKKLEANGHTTVHFGRVKDNPLMVKGELAILGEKSSCQAIFAVGGGAFSARNTAYDALSRMIEKPIDGFGEFLRHLSFQSIGADALLYRATAGLYRGRLLVAMPGAVAAVELAADQLLIPTLGQIVSRLKSPL